VGVDTPFCDEDAGAGAKDTTNVVAAARVASAWRRCADGADKGMEVWMPSSTDTDVGRYLPDRS
jgi:hypothetical protein